VKTLLCLSNQNQSTLERLFDFLPIKAAFADTSTTVNLEGSGPCVNETTNVLVDSTLVAQNDTVNTWIHLPVSASVALNDAYPTGSVFSLKTTVAHGKLIFNEDGSFTYSPKGLFKGVDGFTYGLCEPDPKSTVCATAAVTLNVGTVKLAQHVLNLTASRTTTSVNLPVKLVAKGGDVSAIPAFNAVSSAGAYCKIRGSGSLRTLRIRGETGATCTVTATKRGNKEFEPVTSNSVTVTLQ